LWFSPLPILGIYFLFFFFSFSPQAREFFRRSRLRSLPTPQFAFPVRSPDSSDFPPHSAHSHSRLGSPSLSSYTPLSLSSFDTSGFIAVSIGSAAHDLLIIL
jgi:hypothetical protein